MTQQKGQQRESPILAELVTDVRAATTVMDGATIYINGNAARLEAAIAKALENGATAEQLAPVKAEVDAAKASAAALAAAMVEGTTSAR